MHSTSDNIKFTHNNANKVVNKFFESLCSKYQDNLEISMRRSNFIFDSVQLVHYKCHDSPDWMKKQKSDNKSKNEDDNCFQYAATVALNYKLSYIQREFQKLLNRL